MTSQTELPVHDSLHVVASEDIYRNDEWWKSVVRYKFDRGDDYDEAAVYLWHDEDGWTRKNKYVIKTPEAWETDKTIVDRLFSESTSGTQSEFPVSDYYEVAAGETVFRSDGWWKAIVEITQKGSYETEEVMVYLWQEVDDDWRRRQKYTIKSEQRWAEEVDVVKSVIQVEEEGQTTVNRSEASQSTNRRTNSDGESATQPEEFEQLGREIDQHLSEDLTE